MAQRLRRPAKGVGEVGFKEIINTGCFEVTQRAAEQRGQILELPPERAGPGQKSRVRLVEKENDWLGGLRITDKDISCIGTQQKKALSVQLPEISPQRFQYKSGPVAEGCLRRRL